MNTQDTRIVVIGGGYAGVLAANRLRAAGPGVGITLVNPRPHFVERIRLHQLAVGTNTGTHGATGDAAEDYRGLLGDGITLVVDSAERIDTGARRVELASGAALDYDYLVYAVGSTAAVPREVPGAAEFAYPLAEWEEAQRLRARMDEIGPAAAVVVVGGGLTGIEAAAEFAEAGHPVTLVGPTLGPSLGGPARASVARRLDALGVVVLDGDGAGDSAMVTAVGPDVVHLAGGRALPAAVTVWTAGFGVPGLAAVSGLSTDSLGRVLTDETLTSVDDPHIVAAGDAAAPSDLPLRMSCQAAMPLAAQAAQTVLARLRGQAPAPINQAFTGQCVSLGRHGGAIQICHGDDSPRRVHLRGRTAAFVKEQVCRFTVSSLRREARRPGSYRWLRSGWRTSLLAGHPAPEVEVR